MWELWSQQEYTQQPQQNHHRQQQQSHHRQQQQSQQKHHQQQQQKLGTTFALSAQPKQTVADMARGDQSSKPPSRKNSLNSDLSSITQSKLSHNLSQISPIADCNRKEEANRRKSSFSRHFSKEEPPKSVSARIRRSSSLDNLPLHSSSVYLKNVGLSSSLTTSYAAPAAMEGGMKRMALEDEKQRCNNLQKRSSQRYASTESLLYKDPKKTGPNGDKRQRRDSLQRSSQKYASMESLLYKDPKKTGLDGDKRQRRDSLQRSSQKYASLESLSHKDLKKTGPDEDKRQRRDSLQRSSQKCASLESLSHKDLKKAAQRDFRENKRKLSQEGVHQKSLSSTPSIDDSKHSENNKRPKKSGCFLPLGNTLNKVKIFSKKNHDVKKHPANERRNNPTKAYKLDPPYATH